MPGYLLDTNTLSILALRAPRAGGADHARAFRAWVRENDETLFLSVITNERHFKYFGVTFISPPAK